MAVEKAAQPDFVANRQQRVSEFVQIFQKASRDENISVEVKVPETKKMDAIEKQKTKLDESISKEGAELKSRIQEFKDENSALSNERKKAMGDAALVTSRGEAALHSDRRRVSLSHEKERKETAEKFEKEFDGLGVSRIEEANKFNESASLRMSGLAQGHRADFNALLDEAEASLLKAPQGKAGEVVDGMLKRYGEMETRFAKEETGLISKLEIELEDMAIRQKSAHDATVSSFQGETGRMEQRQEAEWEGISNSKEAIEAREWKIKGDGLFAEDGKFSEALEAYSKAVEIDPCCSMGWNGKGISLKNLGRNAEAAEAFEKAVGLEERNPSFRCNLGESLLALGKYPESAKQYRDARLIDPENSRAWEGIGKAISASVLSIEMQEAPPEKQAQVVGEYEKMAEKVMKKLADYWFYPRKDATQKDLFESVRQGLANPETREDTEMRALMFLKGVINDDFGYSYETRRLLSDSVEKGDWTFNCYSGSVFFGDICARAGLNMTVIATSKHVLLSGEKFLFETTARSASDSVGPKDDGYIRAAYGEYVENGWERMPSTAHDWTAIYLRERAKEEKDPAVAAKMMERAMKNADEANLYSVETGLFWYRKGDLFETMGKMKEAHDAYRKGLQFNPADATMWACAGNSSLAMGNNAEALKELSKALEISPDNRLAELYKENLMRNIATHDEILSAVNEALAESPNAIDLLNDKARVLDAMGRKEEMIAVYDRLVEVGKDPAGYLHSKARLMERLGRKEEMMACFDRLIELEPENMNWRMTKAERLGEMGRVDDAVAVLDEVLKGSPDAQYALETKSRVLAGANRFDEAAAIHVKLAETAEPGRAFAPWMKAGYLIEKSGRKEEALSAYEKAEKADEKSAKPNMSKAEILLSLGKKPEALAEAEKAVGKPGYDHGAKEMKVKLQKELGAGA